MSDSLSGDLNQTPNNVQVPIHLQPSRVDVPFTAPKDAYQLAKMLDPSIGTLEEWLASLQASPIEMQVEGGYIQWKLEKDQVWVNLLALNTLISADTDLGGTEPSNAVAPSQSAVKAYVLSQVDAITLEALGGQPAGSYATLDEGGKVPSSQLPSITLEDLGGQPAGSYATLDEGGKVPSSQLPSYVDDVLEAADVAHFPSPGAAGIIYVALDTGKAYRWGGSAYVEISASPGSTDAVPEGSVNFYFTAVRAAAAAPVQSVNGLTGNVVLNFATPADVQALAGQVTLSAVQGVMQPVSISTSVADDDVVWMAPSAKSPGKWVSWLTGIVNKLKSSFVHLTGGQTIQSSAANVVTLTLKGASTQSANLLEAKDSAGVTLASISQFGGLVLANNLQLGSGQQISWGARGAILQPGDGIFRFSNNAGTGAGGIVLGNQTSAFPYLKRNAAGIDLRVGDDTAYGTFTAGCIGIGGAPDTNYNLTGTGAVSSGFKFVSGTRVITFVCYAGDQNYFSSTGAQFRLGTSDNQSMYFVTNNSARGFLMNDGKWVFGPTVLFSGARVEFQTTSASEKGMVIRASTSQTANLLDIQNDTGGTMFYVSSGGIPTSTGGIFLSSGYQQAYYKMTTADANAKEAFVILRDGQLHLQARSAPIYFETDSTYTSPKMVLDVNGRLTLGLGTTAGGGQFHLMPDSATTKGLIIRSFSGQTATLQEWQAADGSNLAYMSSAGNLIGTGFSGGQNQAGAGRINASGLGIVSYGLLKATSDGVFLLRNNADNADASLNVGTLTATSTVTADVYLKSTTGKVVIGILTGINTRTGQGGGSTDLWLGADNNWNTITYGGTGITNQTFTGPKMTLNSTQLAYIPGGNFTGSMFIGTGGGSLTFTAANEGCYNTGLGIGTLFSNTKGKENNAVGYYSLYANTTGYGNNAFGVNALRLNTTGNYNTAFASSALYSNTTGSYNTAIGLNAINSNTNGNYNTGIGFGALNAFTSGNSNTAIGMYALYSITGNGMDNNVSIGSESARYIADGVTTNTSCTNSTFIGTATKPLASGQTNQTVIGYGAIGNGSNTVTIGNSSITDTYLQGTVRMAGAAVVTGNITGNGTSNTLPNHVAESLSAVLTRKTAATTACLTQQITTWSAASNNANTQGATQNCANPTLGWGSSPTAGASAVRVYTQFIPFVQSYDGAVGSYVGYGGRIDMTKDHSLAFWIAPNETTARDVIVRVSLGVAATYGTNFADLGLIHGNQGYGLRISKTPAANTYDVYLYGRVTSWSTAPNDNITAATNASPIVITQNGSPHNLVTGDKVEVYGVSGNTAANGIWTVTVINSTTFSLDGSTGNGAWTSGGVVNKCVGPITWNPVTKRVIITWDGTSQTARLFVNGDITNAALTLPMAGAGSRYIVGQTGPITLGLKSVTDATGWHSWIVANMALTQTN